MNIKLGSLLFTAILALGLTFAGSEAEARRLGGGSSFGKQSSNVTQRQAPPTRNQADAQPGTSPAAGAAAPRRPIGAMLGGLAAGLGLAWLASSLGLGGAFGQIIMFALLAFLVMAIVGFVLRRLKGNAQANPQGERQPYAFQGAGAASTSRQYSPETVGNDASARPWERASTAFDSQKLTPGSSTGGSMIGSALSGSQSWGVPAGFDSEGFIKACKANFVTLQDAWDRSDINALRSMMTDEMVGQIQAQLAEREQHTGGGANKTDVVMLEAQLLGIEELSDSYLASVEFSGMIREDASAGASPFREVWNMTKSKAGRGGWLVAGVQALQ